MLQSKLFCKTLKPAQKAGPIVAGEEKSSDIAISHDLLVRAGFVDQLMAGVYTFLPLGLKVLKNIENIIRKNMEQSPACGQEVLMPVLQPKENWQKTGRWETFDILFKIKGGNDKEYALGPTHEEVVSPLAKKNILSYKDLPIYLFQIQTKFRNELRAKSGILRTREFLMKDLYSFHATQNDIDKYYEKMLKVYFNIFKECGIYKGGKNPLTYRTLASGGSFSKYSDEFQTVTDSGEDTIYICKKCLTAINKEIINENKNCPNCKASDFEERKALEVGNIFKLGTKYSLPFDLKFRDKDGSEKLVIMGCYGIGLSRLMGAIVEISHDDKGIIWPKSVAPFLVHLIEVKSKPARSASSASNASRSDAGRHSDAGGNEKVKNTCEKIYNDLQKQGIEVLYDDRQSKSVGEKFAEADLMGIPYRIVVSEKTLKSNSVEVKERGKNTIEFVKTSQLIKKLK